MVEQDDVDCTRLNDAGYFIDLAAANKVARLDAGTIQLQTLDNIDASRGRQLYEFVRATILAIGFRRQLWRKMAMNQ